MAGYSECRIWGLLKENQVEFPALFKDTCSIFANSGNNFLCIFSRCSDNI